MDKIGEKRDDKNAHSVIALDFETTGLSPDMGDRAIEIGAVKIESGKIVGEFQQLMNPGMRISGFIESYTGITNKMLKSAPPCSEVMYEFSEFIGDSNLVAHNASFDKRFLDAELDHISQDYAGEFSCSMLIARRIYPDAPNHKLETLIRYKNLLEEGAYHRALFDSKMTAKLWLLMLEEIQAMHTISHLPFSLMRRLSKTPKGTVPQLLSRFASKQSSKSRRREPFEAVS